MRILELDIGNTKIKWRLINLGEVAKRGLLRTYSVSSLDDIFQFCGSVDEIWIASVASDTFEDMVAAKLVELFDIRPWFAPVTPGLAGVKNGYIDEKRLGVDRWLAMVAAWKRFKRALVVIDAGTAITLDIVNTDGYHLGGVIAPGWHTMVDALVSSTVGIGVSGEPNTNFGFGRNTEAAVSTGLRLAQIGLVREAIRAASEELGAEEQLLTIFCGGGGKFLKDSANISGSLLLPDLVFDGLKIAARELL